MPHSSGASDAAEREELQYEMLGLDELAAPPPDENPADGTYYRHSELEEASQQRTPPQDPSRSTQEAERRHALTWTQVHTYSYLIFFSILGVLARLGLQALTLYPGALVPITDLWANFGGSLVIGFLREDRMLFQSHWKRSPENPEAAKRSSSSDGCAASPTESDISADNEAVTEAYRASRASVPGYIGLTVGFCGSFTSFASVARDAFLAISNNVDTNSTAENFVTDQSRIRSAGYSVMAVLSVCLLEVGLSLIGLKSGAHVAAATANLLQKHTPEVDIEEYANYIVIPLGCGTWIGAIILTIFTPYDAWRGQVLFSLVFAPVGSLLRFRLSIQLNRLLRTFPLGTFVANTFGSAVLGMSYDLQHSSAGRNVVGCQVLQGVEDGFCGALTTVSTWVLELDTLKLKHAYLYGLCSLCVAIGLMAAIIGPLRWTSGLVAPSCIV